MLQFSSLVVGRAMDAANHSKNNAMGAENHVKDGACSKSLMSRNFFNVLSLSLLAAIFIFTGCHKEPKEDKISAELYAMGIKSAKGKRHLLFTGDDIISFDNRKPPPTMGIYPNRIVFTELKTKELKESIEQFVTLFLYLHGELVFDPPIPTYFPIPISITDPTSNQPSDLQLIYTSNAVDGAFHLVINFNFMHGPPDMEMIEKREKQLDLFIEYLRDMGKVIE